MRTRCDRIFQVVYVLFTIMAFYNKQIILLIYYLCILSQVVSSKFGIEDRPTIVIFSSTDNHDNQTKLKLNRTTWRSQRHTRSNEELASSSTYHVKSRQIRSAPDSPLDLVGDEDTDAPSQLVAFQNGDFILGGMFAVLIPDEFSNPCSKILKLTGLRMESMMYAVDVINNNTDVLPDIKLGFEIRNDCSDPNKALREALSFITVNGGESCASDDPQTIGVVGTGSSATSTGVANLLGLFKVPQVSYSASSPVLSNKKLYPYFLRTIASDTNQAEVMADLAEDMGWNYVAIIFTSDNYGTSGMELLTNLLEARSVCIAHTLSLNRDSPDDVVVNIIQTLLKDTKISVIFTFCLKHDIGRVLAEAQEQELTDRTWIASDSWGQSMQTVEGMEPVVRGMLGIIPKSSRDENFERYLSNLDPYSNLRNPWYQLTLGELFNCTFDPLETLKRKVCTGAETFADVDDTHARFVIDAVHAFAYGLHNMISQCSDCLNSSRTLDLKVYLDYVKTVGFHGLTNPNFKFNDNGDPMAQYEIHNLQHHGGKYTFVKVADWDPTSKFSEWLHVDWQTGRVPPVSRCSEDCAAGNFITLQTPKCCWECHQCEAGSISTSQNSLQCKVCSDGERTSEYQTACLVNPIVYLEWDHAVAIVLVILTIIGLLATGFTLAIYIRHRKSATIKATSTELSYLLLIGIAMSYSSTFLFVAIPTDEICNAKIVMVGTSFSVYVGALLMKTNRISQFFNRKLSDGAPSIFLSIKYQLMFALGIVGVQVALQVVWLQLEPGVVVKDTSDPEVTLLQCEYSSFLGPAVAVGFNAVLAVLCLYKAFRIRKLPGQFNDSRGICFAMLTCCLIWFIFFSCYFTTTGIVNSIICSVAFIASGTSGLICMFVPKIWIVIMRPERNIRQSTLKLKTTTVSGTTIRTVSREVNKKNGRVSLAPTVADLSHSSSHSSEADSISQVSDEDDEQRFLMEIAELEEELKDAEMERDDAVAKADEMYQEMLDLQKIQEDELRKADQDIDREKNNMRQLLKSEGMEDDDIDQAVACSGEGFDDMETNDSPLKVNELVSKLDAVLAERDKLNKQVRDLKLECQRFRNIILQDGESSSGNGKIDNFVTADDTLAMTDLNMTFV